MAQNTAIHRLTSCSTPEMVSRYHKFVDTSPQGILYSKTWWLEATAPGRWEILLLLSGDEIRAAWPLVYTRGRRAIGMPPLTQKLGVLFAPSSARYSKRLGDEIAACEQLIDQVSPAMGVRQQFHEEFSNWLAFMWRGFEQTTKYTYVFDDLENVAQYTSRMSDDCRQRIKKSVKELAVSETEDLQLMYDVNALTFRRQGISCPFPFDLVERIHFACKTHAGARILIAKDAAGNLHACDYMIYDERCAVSLIQGADPQFRKGGAQRLLDWESIQFAATVSKRFDFEGSVMPGVEPYNRGFGAKQAAYFVLRRPARINSRIADRPRRFIANALQHLAERIQPLG